MDDLIGMFTGESKPAPRPQAGRGALAPRPSAPISGGGAPDEPPVSEAQQDWPRRDPPPASPPRGIDDLLPPEDIPTVGSIERPRQRRGAQERSIFEDLFGGG